MRILCLISAMMLCWGCSDTATTDDNDAHDGTTEMADDRVIGATDELEGSTMTSWARFDDDGAVLEVGVTLERAGLETASEDSPFEELNISLAMPEGVATTTFFDHVQIDFGPMGHEPGPYLVPHFDFHFYGIAAATLQNIDCVGEPEPEANRLPERYFIPSTAAFPDGTCVPDMGVHALDPASPELARESPQPFTQHMVFGYHEGSLSFIEPMIAQTFLAEGNELQGEVPRPAVLGRATRYPGSWSLQLTEDLNAYEIVFSNFTDIE